MFEFAKVVGFLIAPLTFALGFGLIAIICVARNNRRMGLGIAAADFVILWIASTPWCAHGLSYRLETQYEIKGVGDLPNADAIVLLGGRLAGAIPPRRHVFDLGAASDRVWHAAALFRAGKVPVIIVSGGNQTDDPRIENESAATRQMLLALGVPDSAIQTERESRNTRENATKSRALIASLKLRRVLLVTSAQHMPRALATFRRVWAGLELELIAASTDVEAFPDLLDLTTRWLPDVGALAITTRAIKEYIGLVAIKLNV